MPLKLTRRTGSPFWWVAGTIRGERIRQSTGTADARAAAEYRTVAEAEAYRRAIHGEGPRRVAFSAAVLSYLESEPRTPPTKARLARLLKHFGPTITCDQIGQEQIDGAARKLLRQPAKPATKLREVTTPVRAILTHAARRGWCAVPVFERARNSPARTAWMRPAEVDALEATAASHLRPLIVFLAATGARLSEALRLTWPDVDLKHGRALLRGTKNGDDRTLDLCPRVVASLAGQTHRVGAVFRTSAGVAYQVPKRQQGGQIKTAWAGAMRRAALGGMTPHGLRHTWATWHYALHRDLIRLRQEGGWRSASQVERYAKLAPETLAPEIRAWRGEIGTKLPHVPIRRTKGGAKSAA